jgi:hypothetical protein
MSSLSKDLLVFDAAQAANSDNVGAYLRASDGTLLTHTDVSGKKALDVNVANALTIDVDLDQSTDSVAIGDGTNLVSVSASGELSVKAVDFDIRNLTFADDKVDVSGSEVSLDAATLAALENITVSATDLDIRDLAFATDSVTAHQGGSWTVTATATDFDIRDLSHTQDSVKIGDGSQFLEISASGEALVTATDFDIRDLNSASDSVSAVQSGAWSVTATGNVADDAADSGNPLKVGSRAVSGPLSAVAANDRADLISDLYRRLQVSTSANISSLSSAVSVADSAVALPASPLAGRRKLLIQNLSNQPIFIGHSGVTTSSGARVAAGGSYEADISDDVVLYAISANATAKDVRVLELA